MGGMERRRLGRTDMMVGVLGFGAAEIGYQAVAARTVAALLDRALDAGVNVIDTAECYAGSEALLGRALAGRRHRVHLFTKCGHPGGWGRPDWRPASLLASIERSLERLGTDHLDLIQLHSCSLAVLRRGDVIAALEQARQRGLARWIGYSGDGEAARFAVECGRFDTLQTSVSIADQEAVEVTIPLARQQDLGVIAKRPLANVAWQYPGRPAEPYHREYWTRLRALDYPFLRHAAGAAVATALRFTVSVPGVHTAIVGTARADRLPANARLLAAGPLPAEAFAAIRARWAAVAGRSWAGQV